MVSFKASRYLGSCFSINEFLAWHYWFTQWNWKEICYFYFSILLACNSLKRPQGCRVVTHRNRTPIITNVLRLSFLYVYFQFWNRRYSVISSFEKSVMPSFLHIHHCGKCTITRCATVAHISYNLTAYDQFSTQKLHFTFVLVKTTMSPLNSSDYFLIFLPATFVYTWYL